MSSVEIEINFLRTKGYRVTPQRIAVLEILHAAIAHLQASEIYRQTSKRIPGINEATVYRTLELLTKEGVIQKSYLDGSQIAYEINRPHHHLICRSCGEDIEIKHHLLESTYSELEKLTGYDLDSSHLNFYGLCPGCKSRS